MKSLSIFLLCATVCLLTYGTTASIGVDTAPLVSFQSTFDCLKDAGYGFANVRAFTLEGIDLDLSVKDTLIYAQRAGFKTDLFIRPCRGKSAKYQIVDVILIIAEQYYNKFWLYLDDNPNPGCKWSTDYKSNCEYVKLMLNQIKSFQKQAGIYSSQRFWKNTFGSLNGCPQLGTYPLIYPNNDKDASFKDFSPFGGWSVPSGKMFQSNVTACGTTINKVYKESQTQNLQRA